MKRMVSIAFLLFAIIVILAHCFIPHHYHHDRGVACITVAACACDDATHNHCSDSDEDASDCCIVKKLYFRSGDERETGSINRNLTDTIPIVTMLPHDRLTSDDDPFGNLPFRQKPYLNTYYSCSMVFHHGLRAPPVC